MPTTTERPPADVSDRGAALDRVARLGVLHELLRFLHSWDLLDDLPDDYHPETSGRDWIGEMNTLHVALFPHDIPDSEGNGDPEWDLVLARERAMLARLFLRLADRSDGLRETAEEMMRQANEGMHEASDALGDLQEWFERRASERKND